MSGGLHKQLDGGPRALTPPAWLSSPPWPARLPEGPPGGPDQAWSTAETLPPSVPLHTAWTAGGHCPPSATCTLPLGLGPLLPPAPVSAAGFPTAPECRLHLWLKPSCNHSLSPASPSPHRAPFLSKLWTRLAHSLPSSYSHLLCVLRSPPSSPVRPLLPVPTELPDLIGLPTSGNSPPGVPGLFAVFHPWPVSGLPGLGTT